MSNRAEPICQNSVKFTELDVTFKICNQILKINSKFTMGRRRWYYHNGSESKVSITSYRFAKIRFACGRFNYCSANEPSDESISVLHQTGWTDDHLNWANLKRFSNVWKSGRKHFCFGFNWESPFGMILRVSCNRANESPNVLHVPNIQTAWMQSNEKIIWIINIIFFLSFFSSEIRLSAGCQFFLCVSLYCHICQ